MAYFNNASFYSTPSASEELDAYQLLSQTSATQRVNDQAHVTLADRWGMVGQHGPTVGSSTGLPAAASYGEYHATLSSIGDLHVSLQNR